MDFDLVIKIVMLVLFFGVMVGVGVYCRKNTTNVSGFVPDSSAKIASISGSRQCARFPAFSQVAFTAFTNSSATCSPKALMPKLS